MGTQLFRRTARMPAPLMPGGEVHLEPPPEVPRVIPGSVLVKLLPVVMILASAGFIVVMGPGNPTAWLFGGMFAMSTVGLLASGGRGGAARKAELDEDRKDYLRYLGQMREKARQAAAAQRTALEWTHPDPQALWSLGGSRRMWERRPADPDFLAVRVGRGSQRLATRLTAPQTGPVDDLEPIAALALRRFVTAHGVVGGLPTAVSLRSFAAVSLRGERGVARALARAMVAQMVTFHSPDDLLVAVIASGRARDEWEWVKWLPHAQHPTLTDGIGSLRMVTGSLARVERWLDPELRDRGRFARNTPPQPEAPQVVVVIDEGEVSGEERIVLEEGLVGVTLLDLSDSLGTVPARRGLRLVTDGGRLGAHGAGDVEWFAAPDGLSVAEAAALARRLAPFRTSGCDGASGEEEPLLSNPRILEMLGIEGDPTTFDVAQAWRPRPVRDRLRVPFGVGEQGQLVELDIKEAAQEGTGPHGLCVGATGSGKSELLRTLVLGMVITHPPSVLNLVLVDFKGGATFHGLGAAPHVAAVITNLADDLTLVDRMRDALAGEMNRRQELLKAAGNLANVKAYERARQNGADLDPLPALFIVVDEFSELLVRKPDLAELFAAIGRLGRSLQMHLLLASQRLEEGRLRGLESHLSYRIGLKTFSASDSRVAIGVPDAYELPPIPGSGYLKLDTTSMVRFKAGYVSGPYRAAAAGPVGTAAPVTRGRRPLLFVPDVVERPKEPEKPVEPTPSGPEPGREEAPVPSVLDVIVGRLAGQGPPAHEVWLPPLSDPPSLGALLPPLSETEDRGLRPVGFTANGRLTVPVGIVDKPFDQRRDLLWADFSGAAGHAAVVGGPQAGKSTLLRSLVMSTALTHTPAETQFYCLDFGGGTLASLEKLPHVGAVASRMEPDLVRRTVAEITSLVGEREQRFRRLGVDSIAEFRDRRRRGEVEGDAFGDVFLVIDGWLTFRQEFDLLEPAVTNLATQGLSYGVHVVITATRWAELRPALKDLLGTRFELRLGDPSESDVDRRAAANVPPARPGRGITREGLHFLTALPRVDAASGLQDAGTAEAVAEIAGAWHGRYAPQVRLLPAMLPYAELPGPAQQPAPHLIPLGVDEERLAPVYLDFAAESHFMCFADGESGKTNLLRTIVTGVVSRFTPDAARVVLVDYRRTMLGFVSTDHLIGYAATAQSLRQVMSDVQGSLSRRMPGPDVTQEQLKQRSWWSGPEVYVVVDDYDLVATQSGNPLTALLEFLPQAKDVGLHLIVARRSGGASRALFEPVLARLRELSTPGIVMSGNKDEGVLLGTVKPAVLPPGRGRVVGRKLGQQLVQVAWLAPE